MTANVHHLQDVFECAQCEYVDEGVPWAMVSYSDNRELLERFDGKLGLWALLNEECMLPKVVHSLHCETVSEATAEAASNACVARRATMRTSSARWCHSTAAPRT